MIRIAATTALLLGLISAEAAPMYTLTICAHQPRNSRQNAEAPITAGKIITADGRINTTSCSTRRYSSGSRVLLHARTIEVKLRNTKFQTAFNEWESRLYPETTRGPLTNACQNLGEEETCLIVMNRNRRAAGSFRWVKDQDEFLYEYEWGSLPVCKILGVSDDARTVTCTRNGYTWKMDRNGTIQGYSLDQLTTNIYYTGLNCTGEAYVDAVHKHLYRTRAPGFRFDELVSVRIDRDDPGEPSSQLWSGWDSTLGCLNFNEGMYKFGHQLRVIPGEFYQVVPGYGGSYNADRGVGIGPSGH